jgi:tetratricopeptide (TPR) repeat protein
MAITIEGYAVVAQRDRIQHLLDADKIQPPNSRFLGDDDLWRCCFMTQGDAELFREKLAALDLNVAQGPDSDAVIVSEFDQSVDPYCEWLSLSKYEKSVIGWKTGTEPKTIIAHEGWDPKIGSGLEFHDMTTMDSLEFLRLDGNVEVYLNKETGKEVYLGRTKPSLDARFRESSATVMKNMVDTGHEPLTGIEFEEVSNALKMMDEVIAEAPDAWRPHWVRGKGMVALGDLDAAYDSFKQAFELESEDEVIPRELGGVCLELGKFEEAVKVSEKAASILPDSPTTLGNLAVSYLLSSRIEEANKTIDAALKIDQEDSVNQYISKAIKEVKSGTRQQPTSMSDLTGRSKPKSKTSSVKKPSMRKKKFWQFWK